jgi:peptidyl-prolyl cis-trans isomerase B (cyclophilin B)
MPEQERPPRVVLATDRGDIVIELYAEKAPVSTANFLAYVSRGHYDGTIFHRVIPEFVIQGGGFTTDMSQKPTAPPIINEADNGLKNYRGTVAMARTPDPHSASSQFFINLADNDFLDHTAKTPQGWGYAVFGRVVKGMEVVDAIAQSETGSHGPHRDVPVTPTVVRKASLQE